MLFLVLSALALCASIIRVVAQVQLFSSVGVPFPGSSIIYMELGNWLAWTVWAAILVWVFARTNGLRARWQRVIVSIMLAAVPTVFVPLLVSPVHVLVMNGPNIRQSFLHVTQHNVPTNALLGVTMVGVVVFHGVRQRARTLALTAAALRAELAESQLSTLRSQMDPHFLFNALNGIAVLARRGQHAAVERMVTGLSELLRYSLDTASAQTVPLRIDLDALRRYLDVEEARFGGRLSVALDVPEMIQSRMVPSFLLQPIVENAIRHGFEDGSRPLNISVVARDNAGALQVTVTDDGIGLGDRPPSPDGIGVGHSRARLTGLYGPDASLVLTPGAHGRGVCVTITIPAASA